VFGLELLGFWGYSVGPFLLAGAQSGAGGGILGGWEGHEKVLRF
jgi:hypothetical protein